MSSNFASCPHVRLIGTLKGHVNDVTGLAWSPDGYWLASCSLDGTLNLWSSLEAKKTPRFRCPSGAARLTSVAWTHDGKYVACGAESGALSIWEKGLFYSRPHSDSGAKAAIRCLAWAPDSALGDRRLAFGGDDRTVYFRNFADWHRPDLEIGIGHEGIILSIAWSPDATTVVTGTDSGTIGVWAASERDNQLRDVLGWQGIRAHDGPVVTLAWSPHTGVLASGSTDGRLHLWNVKENHLLDHLDFQEEVLDVEFTLNGAILVVQTRDHLRIVRCRPLREIYCFEFPATLSPSVNSMAVGPLSELATIALEDHSEILAWHVGFETMLRESEVTRRSFAAVGVSLLGESGSGRTNIALALTHRPFTAAHRTHSFTVHRLRADTIERDTVRETRELAFWDLPSRIDHALVQHVHAGNGAITLIILPATPGTFATANDNLERWRETLKRWQDASPQSASKWWVVVNKCDQLSRPPAPDDATVIAKTLAVDKVFLVSVKTGSGVAELRQSISDAITWETFPSFPSVEAFDHLTKFVQDLRDERRYLTSLRELYTGFLRSYPFLRQYIRDESEFRNGVALLEILGELQFFERRDEILLDPTFYRAYASAMIAAAERDESGMRRLPLEEANLGRGRQFQMVETERIGDIKQERRLLGLTIDELLEDEIAQVVSTDGVSHLVFKQNLLRIGDAAEPRPERATSCLFSGIVDDVFMSLVVRLSGLDTHYPKSKVWRNRASFEPASGGRCEVTLEPNDRGDEAELSVYFHEGTNEVEQKSFVELVRRHLKKTARTVTGDLSVSSGLAGRHGAAIEVFLSWRVDDEDSLTTDNVRQIEMQLNKRGIRTVGSSQTKLGVPRQERATDAGERRVALLLVGGPLSKTQEFEYHRLRASGCRIIPVILPNARRNFVLPDLLKDWEWLDFRGKFLDDEMDRLVTGVSEAWRLGPISATRVTGHVFISYFRDDYPLVCELQEELEGAGHRVWWDQGEELRPGTSWAREINEAIKRSYAFLICLSDTYLERRQSFVYPELRQAIKIQYTMRTNQSFIVPVRLSPCEMPDEPIDDTRSLQDLQYFDYFGENRRIAELITTLDSLRAQTHGKTPKPFA